MLTRRQFIKAGLLGAASLVAARALYGPFEAQPRWVAPDGARFVVLDEASCGLFAALADVILDGALPAEPAARQAAIAETVRNVDIAISGLSPAVRAELDQLFGLLDFPVTRRTVAGVSLPWLKADRTSIEAFLARWRDSRISLLRSGYQGLHKIVLASWYGSPSAWAAIGYGGPPAHVFAA